MQSVWSGDTAMRRKEGRELVGNSASGLLTQKKSCRAEMIEERKTRALLLPHLVPICHILLFISINYSEKKSACLLNINTKHLCSRASDNETSHKVLYLPPATMLYTTVHPWYLALLRLITKSSMQNFWDCAKIGMQGYY